MERDLERFSVLVRAVFISCDDEYFKINRFIKKIYESIPKQQFSGTNHSNDFFREKKLVQISKHQKRDKFAVFQEVKSHANPPKIQLFCWSRNQPVP